ncbi:oligomeric Golgi complex component 3 [Pelomyxa schiedti]|nr:oligomeric Golgi complex component 3 [Pelomyxa schiedti]
MGVAAAPSPSPASASTTGGGTGGQLAVLQTFLANSEVSPQCEKCASMVGRMCVERPVPAKFLAEAQSQDNDTKNVNTTGPSPFGSTLDSTEQFYRWLHENRATCEPRGPHIDTLEQLQHFHSRIKDMISQVDSWNKNYNSIMETYQNTSDKSHALHEACNRLQQQQQWISEFLKITEAYKSHFDELEPLTIQFLHNPSLTAANPEFFTQLAKLDSCIAFLVENYNFRESPVYLSKFKQVQNKAMSMLRAEVVTRLTTLGAQVQTHMQATDPLGDSLMNIADINEAPLMRQFSVLAPVLRPLCSELEKRSSATPEFRPFLAECQNCYVQQRNSLFPLFSKVFSRICSGPNLSHITQFSCTYVNYISHVELDLYNTFFRTDTANVIVIVQNYCRCLYDVLRSTLIHSHDFDTLCTVLHMLKNEIVENLDLPDKTTGSSAVFEPVSKLLVNLQQDFQERLVYLAQRHIRDHITLFTPSDSDLNYPDKLSIVTEGETVTALGQIQYEKWYPTLQASLTLLSKLYLSVETVVFEGLAQEAVSACVEALTRASKMVVGKDKFDGVLFLFQQLLILREQIAPFDVTLTYTEGYLDFSHITVELKQVLSGGFSSLFSLGTFAPQVKTNKIDSKKEMDRAIATTAEQLIMLTTTHLAQGLISLLAKAQQTKSTASEGIAQASKQLEESLKTILPQLFQRMCEYIPQQQVMDNIIRPVMRNILLITHNLQPHLQTTGIELSMESVKQYFKTATHTDTL